MTKEVKRIGVTYGVFDLFHVGHVLLLQKCKEQCDYLIVCLDVDPKKDRPDKTQPILSADERQTMLLACRHVDEVVRYHSAQELCDYLAGSAVRIDVRFSEAFWRGKRYVGDQLPIPIVFIERVGPYSTTSLRERVYNAEKALRKNH